MEQSVLPRNPDATVPRCRDRSRLFGVQPFARGQRRDLHVAESIQSSRCGSPDAALPIFEHPGDRVARQPIGWSKSVCSAIDSSDETLRDAADPKAVARPKGPNIRLSRKPWKLDVVVPPTGPEFPDAG